MNNVQNPTSVFSFFFMVDFARYTAAGMEKRKRKRQDFVTLPVFCVWSIMLGWRKKDIYVFSVLDSLCAFFDGLFIKMNNQIKIFSFGLVSQIKLNNVFCKNKNCIFSKKKVKP